MSNNDCVTIISKTIKSYKNLNADGIKLELKMNAPTTNTDNIGWIDKCINTLLNIIKLELEIKDGDRVGFQFANTSHETDFSISFRRFDQYTPDLILSSLSSVLQSNANFLFDESLVIKVDHVRMPYGCGRGSNTGKTLNAFLKLHKRNIVNPDIRSEDGNMCLAAFIVLGEAYSTFKENPNPFNFFSYIGNRNDLIVAAIQLASEANVDLKLGGGVDEISQFQEHLRDDFNINVFNSRDGRSTIFKSPYTNEKKINLLLENNHFYMLKSVTAVFSSAYYCSFCCTPYNHYTTHKKCPFKCPCCFSTPLCEESKNIIRCGECLRGFRKIETLCVIKTILKISHVKDIKCVKIVRQHTRHLKVNHTYVLFHIANFAERKCLLDINASYQYQQGNRIKKMHRFLFSMILNVHKINRFQTKTIHLNMCQIFVSHSKRVILVKKKKILIVTAQIAVKESIFSKERM